MDDLKSQLRCRTLDISDLYTDASENSNHNIQLYKIELSKYEMVITSLLKVLLPSEIERAQRYRQNKDKNRFIICRGLLKYLIAKNSGLKISEVEFEKSSKHKPYFPKDRNLFFNVSHAGNFAIIAIGNCELGVDIEYLDPQFDFNEILPNVFSETEVNFINNSLEKRQVFYSHWTRKEAIVKAIGKGIDDDIHKIPSADGLHSISSSLLGDFENISVFGFNVNTNYVGALAVTKEIEDISDIKFHTIPNPEVLKVFFEDNRLV
ncbi:MAG: 4'-phosphopantetheinyl transferase family protein [Aquaticitalea sp.]